MAESERDPEGRLPSGDWLGSQHVRFERHGPLARCVVDRPERRNAMTAAMYFALRYATNLVDSDDALAGMLVTGTDDVFIPGGDLSQAGADEWEVGDLLYMDVVPFDALRQSRKPV